MISFSSKGEFEKTSRFLNRASKSQRIRAILDRYGRLGVSALASATPVESGLTASSWGYEIEQTSKGWSLHWTNTNQNDGVRIAIILQFGHGTSTGGWVEGTDYINPALASIFDRFADDAWREVTSG